MEQTVIMDTTTYPYATTTEELIVGARLNHISSGGYWRVLSINSDGSIKGKSDMGATRTVSAEHVIKGLALASYYKQSWLEQQAARS